MGVATFVRHQGKNFGPYEEKELRAQLKAGRIPLSAWVYREEEWALLAEIDELRALHPEFENKPAEAPRADKALAPDEFAATAAAFGTVASNTSVSAEPVWFFIREKKKFGPYSAAELTRQLQHKQLDSGTFVWRPGFSTWQRMAQVAEFSREAMRGLASSGPTVDILIKRKFARAPYEVSVVAHDNTRAIEGKTMVIGEGGLFLSTARPSHAVGARLKLHFREGDAPSFNAVAEIISVVRGSVPGYCMRFVAIGEADRRKIARFVKTNT